MTDYQTKPYARWVEQMLTEMFDIDPTSIALEMRDEEGQTYTCYYNTSSNDRAIMIDAMQDDAKLEWVRNNKEAILELLEEDEDDEELEPDTEADSEG